MGRMNSTVFLELRAKTYVTSTDNFLRMVHPDDRALVLATREKIKKGLLSGPLRISDYPAGWQCSAHLPRE